MSTTDEKAKELRHQYMQAVLQGLCQNPALVQAAYGGPIERHQAMEHLVACANIVVNQVLQPVPRADLA